MVVEPVSAVGCNPCSYPLGFIGPSNTDPGIVAELVNSVRPTQPASEPWCLKPPAPQPKASIYEVLLTFSANVQETVREEKLPAYWFTNLWLNFPSKSLMDLVLRIIELEDANDTKAWKVTRWVHANFPYALDEDNYGLEEFWTPPLLAVRNGKGDCEDGAFLIHSLMLHAGVPWERIRTYGGLVQAGEGARTGGHAWTAYRRETDNEWVILDSSYHINDLPVAERPLMRDDKRYVDNFFYFNLYYWVNTNGVDRIHNPQIYTAQGRPATLLDARSNLLNRYA